MGYRYGGRTKGTPNKKTVEHKEYLAGLKEQYGCPIKGLLSIASSEDVTLSVKVDCWKAVLPYFYAPRRAEDADGKVEGTPTIRADGKTGEALVKLVSGGESE